MRKRYLSAIAAAMLLSVASAQQVNPITQAMLDGYAELLEQNPNDYLTLYERASQYYQLSDYEKALGDIKRAIVNTPAKERAQLASAYALCADINIELKQYADAYDSINKALELTPDSYRWLYAKGNICLHIGDMKAATQAFQAMQRLNPRSTEALFGLAQVAIKEGRIGDAKEYMKEVENIDSNNYITFCRLGDLHREMDEPREAAASYLSAFSLTNNSSRPMSSLLELARDNYDAVQQAVDYALSRTKNVVPLYFISGNAAMVAERYGDAYTTYRQLLSLPQAEAETLYAPMGEICLMRGDLNEADNYLTKALTLEDNEQNNLLKAKTENARGNAASALIYVGNVLRKNPNNIEAMLEGAAACLQNNDDAGALEYLNNAVITDAGDFRPLLVRGYMQSHGRTGSPTSVADFTRAASLAASDDRQTAYKAIAQALSGNTLDAAATVKPLKEKAGADVNAAYLTALYLLNTGALQEAEAMLSAARANGFENDYLLKYFNLPVISVKGLH